MLTWNAEDRHLSEVFSGRDMEAYIPNESTTRRYYVYGLKQARCRPHVSILLGSSGNPLNYQPLIDFFATMGLTLQFLGNAEREVVQIGLRLDVRENARLSRAIVRTIIHYGEGKLEGGLVTPDTRFEYTVGEFNADAGDAEPIDGAGRRARRTVMAALNQPQQQVVEEQGDSDACPECGTAYEEGPGCGSCCGCNECACEYCNPDGERCGNHECQTCYPDGDADEEE